MNYRHPRPTTGIAPREGAITLSRRSAISRALLETVFARSFGAVCLIFGLQALPFAFEGQPAMNQAWAWIIGLALFGSLLLVTIAAATLGPTLPAAGALSTVYAAVIISWPFAAQNLTQVQPHVPWPWYLCNVAMAAAALAFTPRWATLYILGLATAYTLVRLTPPGGHATLLHAILDSGYTLILGVATLVIVSLLRQATTSVDRAQRAATRRYAETVKAHRNEVERLRIDALLHDGVLTTFLLAGEHDSPVDPAIAVNMAKNALAEITVTHTLDDAEKTAARRTALRARFDTAITEFGTAVELHTEGLDGHAVPADVVDDLYAATMQALMNSIQHAGPVSITRRITVTWHSTTLTITISDNGQGFDPTQATDRLGVRTSIIERTRNAGGTAHITSSPGNGTTITLTWSPPQSLEKL